MKDKKHKAGKIGLREIIVAVIVIIFLGSSVYMLLLGMMTGKKESKVTEEELTAAMTAMDYDDSDNENNVRTAVFEQDIVISKEDTSQQPAGQDQSGAADTKAEAKPAEDKAESEYVFPYSDTVRLTDEDLTGVSKDELRKARNEILARHGRIFDSADLKEYFESKSWYAGTVLPEDFDINMDSRLNDTERYNIEMIKKYE